MAYQKEAKDYYKKTLTLRFINELILYKKYFENNNENINQILNSCFDCFYLNAKEKETIVKSAKKELKSLYKLEVISDEPLIIE